MSQHHNPLSHPSFAEPHPSSKKPKEAPESSPRTTHESLDPGSLTVSQIEADNAYFYGADNPLPYPSTERLLRPQARGRGGRGGGEPNARAMPNMPRHVDVYTFWSAPGSGGGTMITCPSDVAVMSLTPTRVEFRRKRKLEARRRNMGFRLSGSYQSLGLGRMY